MYRLTIQDEMDIPYVDIDPFCQDNYDPCRTDRGCLMQVKRLVVNHSVAILQA